MFVPFFAIVRGGKNKLPKQIQWNGKKTAAEWQRIISAVLRHIHTHTPDTDASSTFNPIAGESNADRKECNTKITMNKKKRIAANKKWHSTHSAHTAQTQAHAHAAKKSGVDSANMLIFSFSIWFFFGRSRMSSVWNILKLFYICICHLNFFAVGKTNNFFFFSFCDQRNFRLYRMQCVCAEVLLRLRGCFFLFLDGLFFRLSFSFTFFLHSQHFFVHCNL